MSSFSQREEIGAENGFEDHADAVHRLCGSFFRPVSCSKLRFRYAGR